jgi:hypothetical protein
VPRSGRVRWSSGVALAAYAGISVLYFGLRVASHPGRELIGTGVDPEIFIWSLAWWPHAVLHGQNPIVSHVIWSPVGANLAWASSIPGLALLAAPLTLLAGPTASYNVLAVLLPALAAWTAFVLCRHLTGSFWASLTGGYLFGFSSYMLGQTEGHMHMTSVCLVPLVALVLLRYVEESLSGRRLVLSLGVLLALQISFSTEVFFTLTLATVAALAVAFAIVPAARPRLRCLPGPLAGAYAVAAVLTSPLLAYALLHFQGSINKPSDFPADLLNIVVPTQLTWANLGWARTISGHFRSNPAEAGAYLGLPVLAIVGWFAWAQRRRPAARFLVAALALGMFVELGTQLEINGHRYAMLPWHLIARLPAFDNTLPVRFSMYVALAAAVAVALWASSGAVPLLVRIPLTALAAVAIVPDLRLGVWHELPVRPSFFTAGTYRACFQPDENVMMLPFPSAGDAMLWQAEAGFGFRMANGNLSPSPPSGVPDRGYVLDLIADNPQDDWRPLIQWARVQHVTTIVVDARRSVPWTTLLAPVTHPTELGGVYLYSLRAGGRSPCTSG